jgi:hypothetical protein
VAQELLRAHQEVLAVAVAVMLLVRQVVQQLLDKALLVVLRLAEVPVRLAVVVALALLEEMEQVVLVVLVVQVHLPAFLALA